MHASEEPIAEAPEIGEDVDASLLDRSRLRVLVLVDHVLVEGLGVELCRLRLHPCGHERRQVLPRVPVEQELVVDHLVGGVRLHLAVGDPPAGHGGLAVAREQRVDADLIPCVRRVVRVRRHEPPS
jgi:hypothetical protein